MLPPYVAAFETDLRQNAALFRLPGFSAAVVQDGKIAFRLNGGYADREKQIPIRNDSVFSIASVTKTFTGVMMMQMAREGKISLDDYLLKYPLIEGWHSPRRIDPNIRLRHILNMTSGGIPGRTYCYHGGRFNFLAEVFDRVSGVASPDSYVKQVTARILDPLKLKDTRAGYPDSPLPITSRIVKRYTMTPGADGIDYRESPYDWNSGYPAAGLFSTIEDLAAYTTALDQNRLISADDYTKMTTPAVNDRGEALPYANGWFSQRFAGHALHWAYGQGTTDSALFLRVPDRKLTFIFLPSEAPRFGAGNLLRSPFAVAFVRRFIVGDVSPAIEYDGDPARFPSRPSPIEIEELVAQTMARAFLRDRLGIGGRPERLAELLYRVDPKAFAKPDWPLLEMMSWLDRGALKPAADRLLRAARAIALPAQRRREVLRETRR